MVKILATAASVNHHAVVKRNFQNAVLPELAFLISQKWLICAPTFEKKLEKLPMPYFVAATVTVCGGACVDVFSTMRNVEALSLRENIENPT